jgi:hypothetical protein
MARRRRRHASPREELAKLERAFARAEQDLAEIKARKYAHMLEPPPEGDSTESQED